MPAELNLNNILPMLKMAVKANGISFSRNFTQYELPELYEALRPHPEASENILAHPSFCFGIAPVPASTRGAAEQGVPRAFINQAPPPEGWRDGKAYMSRAQIGHEAFHAADPGGFGKSEILANLVGGWKAEKNPWEKPDSALDQVKTWLLPGNQADYRARLGGKNPLLAEVSHIGKPILDHIKSLIPMLGKGRL